MIAGFVAALKARGLSVEPQATGTLVRGERGALFAAVDAALAACGTGRDFALVMTVSNACPGGGDAG